MDFSQVISRGFGLKSAGDYVVLTTADWKVELSGPAFDEKLSARLGGTPSRFFDYSNLLAHWKHLGNSCAIDYESAGKELDEKVIQALKRSCINCHQDSTITDQFKVYEDFKNWHAMNRQVMRLYQMPPSGVDYESKNCAHPVASNVEDMKLIQRWIEGGEVASGQAADKIRLIHEAIQQGKAAQLKEQDKLRPDIVWKMKKPSRIPAVGAPFYDYSEIAGPLKEDLYVRAASLDTNLAVAHHVNVFATKNPIFLSANAFRKQGPAWKNAAALRRSESVSEEPILWTWSRRKGMANMPNGTAFLIPKGSRIYLQHHYESSGKSETNLTTLSLFLEQNPESKRLIKRVVFPGEDFKIPPGEKTFSSLRGGACRRTFRSCFFGPTVITETHEVRRRSSIQMGLRKRSATFLIIDWPSKWLVF